MGFSLDISVPALTVFIQGLVSFFSPCVLPLIPYTSGIFPAEPASAVRTAACTMSGAR